MLVDLGVLAKIIHAASIDKGETVCEAGTGQGILTVELCKRARHVISYEIDKRFYREAESLLKYYSNLTLVNADIFEIDPPPPSFDVFISNLPYSRSRDAFEWLSTRMFKRGIIMIQAEFAKKLTAKPYDKNYRAISVLSSYCLRMETLFEVPKQSFKPQPKVASVVIQVTPVHMVTKRTIRNLKLLFSERNKKAATIADKFRAKKMFEELGDKKIDQLPAEILIHLAESIQNVRAL
jgi:16S rRNA (adenine1518-N6/adenine1519-N6)-dimethyltransferase